MQIHRQHFTTIIVFLLLFSFVTLAACGRSTRQPAPGSDAESTAVYQTVQAQAAQLTIQALAAQLTAQAGGQPVAPAPGQPPAQETQPPVQQTQPPAAASQPLVTGTLETNCRAGPAKEFDSLGYLGAGESAVVLGKDPSGNWWLIANPRNPAQNCWVWTGSTTLSGDASSVPVEEAGANPPSQPQPPASGTVAATINFNAIVICSQKPYAIFEIVNTGDQWIKSLEIILLEQGSNQDFGRTRIDSRPGLQAPLGCPPGQTDLKPGSTNYIAAAINDLAAAGDDVGAAFTLFSEYNQAGSLTKLTLEFTIPEVLPAPPPANPSMMAVVVIFSRMQTCSGKQYAIFQVVNNGTLPIKSADGSLTIAGDEAVLSLTEYQNKPFMPNSDGCTPTQNIKAGSKGYLPIPLPDVYLAPTQQMLLNTTMCSDINFTGQCVDTLDIPWALP